MSLETLIAARNDCDTAIANAMAAAAAGTLHPTHSEGGQSMDHTGQLAELRATRKDLQILVIQARGPVQRRTYLQN